MRVNVYAEEMTDRVQIIGKEIDGHTFTGLRLYLELPASFHRNPESGALVPASVADQQQAEHLQAPFVHRPGDDDSSAVTFWGKRDLRVVLRKALAELDAYYRDAEGLIAIERRRQIEQEGWTLEHDARHDEGELACAASAYALAAADLLHPQSQGDGGCSETPPSMFPPGWTWKPAGPIRMLVKAGALITAEIDRLVRALHARTDLKVIYLDDCEWWIGPDVASCVRAATALYGDPVEGQYDDAHELADEELDRLPFRREDGDSITFREELADSIRRGGEFPRLFATTEA